MMISSSREVSKLFTLLVSTARVMNPNAKEFFPTSWWDQEVAWREAYEEKARRESEPKIDMLLAICIQTYTEGDYAGAHTAEYKALRLFVKHVGEGIDPDRDHVIAKKLSAWRLRARAARAMSGSGH